MQLCAVVDDVAGAGSYLENRSDLGEGTFRSWKQRMPSTITRYPPPPSRTEKTAVKKCPQRNQHQLNTTYLVCCIHPNLSRIVFI